MSSPEPRHSHGDSHEPEDVVEGLTKSIPVVLPVVGGILIFLLAFIAVTMA